MSCLTESQQRFLRHLARGNPAILAKETPAWRLMQTLIARGFVTERQHQKPALRTYALTKAGIAEAEKVSL